MTRRDLTATVVSATDSPFLPGEQALFTVDGLVTTRTSVARLVASAAAANTSQRIAWKS
jgi:hypothetical protein